jgi:segregation and condensation protein A
MDPNAISGPTGSSAGAEPAPFAAGGSAYSVRLPVFEGPLDLLLHLIRVNEVEITDIPIARIAEQYLEYLDLLRELDLDLAGEYLLMAATLAWIKSRMLLPPNGSGDDEEGADPRAELVARLLEYQRFKEVAEQLGERPLEGRDVFRAAVPGPEGIPEGEREVDVSLFALVEAYRRALRAAPPSGAPHTVEVETITIRERMLAVMEALGLRDRLDLDEILGRPGGGPPGRPLVVATFLAVLELCRISAILLYQGTNEAGCPRGPIHLRRADGDDDGWRARIAEVM